MVEESLVAGFGFAQEWVAEALRAARGRLFSEGTPATKEMVQEYFEARSAAALPDARRDIVEFGSRPYLLLLQSQNISAVWKSLDSLSTILDVGCGPANLLRFLRKNGVLSSYIGYDVDSVIVNLLSESCDDPAAEFVSRPDDLPQFDVAILCNILVYCESSYVSWLLHLLESMCKSNGKLIILEPYPRWYWEFQFDGMKLYPREPHRISRLLWECGWRVTGNVDVALFKFSGRALIRIAYGIVAGPASKLSDT